MQYVKLGNTDIKVSPLTVVCMSFGHAGDQFAWQWAKGVTAPIVGATKMIHLDDAVNAMKIKLTDDEVKYLEEPYLTHPVVGAIKHNPQVGVILLDKK